ncbi:activating signal cointegrator 1 complex subunit 2 homolog [Poecilia latipinna]|uniref:activating signal cointegrator 1 complex subunit 2 homolog n=1 Tax=Poecilia latipinna TaxID=48699 RepID=UPI00072ED407|nr:PREDICTED: activating signal cointegrator 1 complex subunit 2 homolog [Poecilia latipinna]
MSLLHLLNNQRQQLKHQLQPLLQLPQQPLQPHPQPQNQRQLKLQLKHQLQPLLQLPQQPLQPHPQPQNQRQQLKLQLKHQLQLYHIHYNLYNYIYAYNHRINNSN